MERTFNIAPLGVLIQLIQFYKRNWWNG